MRRYIAMKTKVIKLDIISKYCNRRKITLTQLAIELKITRQAIYNAKAFHSTSREMLNHIAIFCAKNKNEYNEFFIQHQLIPSQYQNLCKEKPEALVVALNTLRRTS